MTEQTAALLTRELDESLASNDEQRLNRAVANSVRALVDCQYKTSERVKKIEINEDRRKQRFVGASIMWGVLATIASAGGGALLLRVLSAVPH